MSDKLKLAEAYYMVADHKAGSARRALEIAENLRQCADLLCEQNMRENPPSAPETGEKP